ncbi:ATP synthase F1 subunit delta [Vagococcus intermedius]|uniref:ATP synthase subunit delta n=1 Tax=Vagococcus intermedius TaxID=2991418 RepID=A0AAF0CWP1_9ENTE|nr:ATP synthase F1 subunit delta [Vagococcus intermedius]WEG74092.1 ATP synthase F1 subunit delta [Vagococcus intermedius]WEG76172.1 ATP synthase F1 subunit delta [Vagococcus intermedius]
MKTENLTIDRRYGRVLYETAKEEKHLDETYQELVVLRDVYEDVPELGQILSDDRLEPFEKVEILHDLDKDFSETVSKFLRVIYEYGRMQEIPQIIEEFEFLYYENKGILLADVTSAIELSDKQDEKLKEKIAKSFDYETVILRKKVDPNILGGLVITAAHKVIDNSVRTQLASMHKELLK